MRSLVVLLLCLCCQHSLAGSIAFSLDNDFFLGMDSHYTNGVRLAWLSDEKQQGGCAFATGLCELPGISGDKHKQAWSLALQQMMVTPKDITQNTPNYHDLPYLGFTHLDIGFYGWSGTTLTGYGAALGVIGEGSGAASTQKFIHRLIGSKQPQGWSYQLGPAMVGGVHAFQSHQLQQRQWDDGYGWATHAAYGVDINSFMASVKAAGFISFGRNMTMRFLPDFTGLSTSAAMIGAATNQASHGWSVFAGLLGEYDGYSYLAEHAPAAYDLQLRPWLVNLLLGASHHWGKAQLIFTLRTSNSIAENEEAPLSFGNLTLVWKLP